jgi:hypothetical protein
MTIPRFACVLLALATLAAAPAVTVERAGPPHGGAKTPPALFDDKDPLFSAAQSLQHWWPGDGHVLDLVGNRHATLKNGAKFAAGRTGRAFTFDGVRSVVDLGKPANAPPTPEKAFTLMFWFRAEEQPGWQYLAFCWNGSGMDININENQPERVAAQLGLGLGYQETHGKTWNNAVTNFHPTEQWHHLAFTFDGDHTRLFRDGALASETPWTIYTPSDTPLLLGAEDRHIGVDSFKGQIEDVALFSAGLSTAQVAAVYEAQTTPLPMTLAEPDLQKFDAALDVNPAPLAWYAAQRLPSDATAARAHLRQILPAAPDAKAIAALIQALDSNSYQEREKASADLAAYGPAIAPALRAALNQNPSPEVASRIQALLAAPSTGIYAPNQTYAARIAAIMARLDAKPVPPPEKGLP